MLINRVICSDKNEYSNTKIIGKDVGELMGINPIGIKVTNAEEADKLLKTSQ